MIQDDFNMIFIKIKGVSSNNQILSCDILIQDDFNMIFIKIKGVSSNKQ